MELVYNSVVGSIIILLISQVNCSLCPETSWATERSNLGLGFICTVAQLTVVTDGDTLIKMVDLIMLCKGTLVF